MFHVKHFLYIYRNEKLLYTQNRKEGGKKVYMDEEGKTLASEILQEVKASARRWFIAFLVMVFIEACTIAGFLWYISLPVESEQVAIENDEGNANYIGGDVRGGVYNGENNN